MTARVKEWKVREITHDMSRYGDRFEVSVEGSHWGESIYNLTDSEGFLKVDNIFEIVKETEKAFNINIDGFKCWVPKSAIKF